jgi:AcrR family transcriptional regulator
MAGHETLQNSARPDLLPPGEGSRGAETKARLLDAAERLFGERGFEGTSMRAVTQAAGVSVSAANYHFGSKLALLRVTLLRRVEPLNRRRLERLDALEREAAGRALQLEAILGAFLEPIFEEHANKGEVAAHFRQVAARLYSDPPEIVAAMKQELFAPVARRFVVALATALPNQTRQQITLGFQFTIGVMVHVISGHLATAPNLEGAAAKPESAALTEEELLASMIAYIASGLRAPCSNGGGSV